MKIALSHQRRYQFIQALKDQPYSFFMGTNWAGVSYRMSSQDYARRDKIISILENVSKMPRGQLPVIDLPVTHWKHIYAVMEQTQIKYDHTLPGPWCFTSYTDPWNQSHKRLQKFFAQELGIKKPPSVKFAWSD